MCRICLCVIDQSFVPSHRSNPMLSLKLPCFHDFELFSLFFQSLQWQQKEETSTNTHLDCVPALGEMTALGWSVVAIRHATRNGKSEDNVFQKQPGKHCHWASQGHSAHWRMIFHWFVIQLSALRLASLDANSQQQNLQKMIQSRKQQQKRNHMHHHCAHSSIFAKRMWSLHLKSLEFWFSFESICCKNSCAANNNTEFVFRFACATMCLVTITNWNHHVVTLIILLQVEDLDRVSPKDAKPVNEFRSYSQHICTHENGRKTSRCSKDLRLTIDFETISDLFPGLKTFGSNLDLCLDLQN